MSGAYSKNIAMVAAYDKNRVIGHEGRIPWQGQLPADMKHFKELTTGQTVLFGRTTFDSIGRPLPNRRNLVLSKDKDLAIEGVEVVNSLEEALEMQIEGDSLFIAGGQKVYELFMPLARVLHVTEIEAEFEGDTFFIDISPAEWKLTSHKTNLPDDKNKFLYTFRTYERRD